MNSKGLHILKSFQRKWQISRIFLVFLYAVSLAFLGFAIVQDWWVFGLILLVSFTMGLIYYKPWKFTLKKVSAHFDRERTDLEYSSGLLLQPTSELTGLARLQRQQVDDQIKRQTNELRPYARLGALFTVGFVLFLFGLLSVHYDLFRWTRNLGVGSPSANEVPVYAVDSLAGRGAEPQLVETRVFVNYPNYTALANRSFNELTIEVLNQSRVSWAISFDQPMDSVWMEGFGAKQSMRLEDGSYRHSEKITGSGFYNFRFKDTRGATYTSDLYSITATSDEAPEIQINDLEQYTNYTYEQQKNLRIKAEVTDDFGLVDARIIATVTKGSGESVKFREEQIEFPQLISLRQKSAKLSKTINLDSLNMEPGDELYFYVEVVDNKEPKANVSRSETYFAMIRDTVSAQFAVEGTMGADLMPDYFRSQRQLIIDTEKLIANKAQLTEKEFKSKSNELGFDQKALRLKYGQFMGDEAESGIQPQGERSTAAEEVGGDDPLAEYTHDHDGDNEHNLVDHDHEGEEHSESEEDPLEAYVHNHEDPEASTLFAKSLKSMLRQAMDEMWDAELYLRLYTPEKSLPYQYKALRLIQEIKNSARIYVHRIGFDPPPIKEDKRLTGELKEVNSFSKQENPEQEDTYVHMRQAATVLDQLIADDVAIGAQHRTLFAKAGQELAQLAIDSPGNYLETLQHLRWLSEERPPKRASKQVALKGLLQALPEVTPSPSLKAKASRPLDQLLLKALQSGE
ncbi:tryptophan-rich sensory protein [Croceiramulus getboli]|nr:tryptophan-rich sensory protein [Flavobacteriaceae bacterium YJPT1-3]